MLQQPDQAGQLPQVAGVGAGEGHALAAVRGHIQRVVPVRAPQPADVVLPYLIEGGQLLDQQMLEDAAGVDFPCRVGLPAALFGAVVRVDGGAAHGLRVLEVGGLPVKDLDVPGLVDVEFGGHLRPQGVVHPDPGDAVAVGDEVAVPRPDDGGVGAVGPHPAEVFLDHLPDAGGVHQQQGQAVLPQIAPAAPAPAIVVVGQERTAEQPPQERLEADPPHQLVEVFVAGGKRDVHPLLPDGAGLGKGGGRPLRAAVALPDAGGVGLAGRHAEDHHIRRLGAGGEGDVGKAEGAHRLPPFGGRAGRQAGAALGQGAGPQIGAALPQEVLDGGPEADRLFPVGPAAAYIIKSMVGPVPPLVKRHGGPHEHPVRTGPDAVQHRGDVAVVPDVVGAAAIDGHSRRRGQPAGGGAGVAHLDKQDLSVVVQRAEGGQLGLDAKGGAGAGQPVPHQPGFQAAVVLGGGEAGGLLPGGCAGGRKGRAVLADQPEVAHPAVVMQVLGADRLQQEGLLVELGVAPHGGGDGALHPRVGGQGEVQVADVLGLVQGKAALPVHKAQVVQSVASPFLYGLDGPII